MDFKNSLMTGAREHGFHSIRRQGCKAPTFHELIYVAPEVASKPVVTIDHSVENYRLLHGPGVEYVEQVLNYSRTHSLSRRGVSKLVVDEQNYIRLQHHPIGHPESESLLNQLLEEGVEIVPLDDVVQYSKSKYPAIINSLNLLKNIPLDRSSESGEEGALYSRFFSYVIGGILLPDYAFNRDSDRNLKTVTVTHFEILASLFLPNIPGREDESLVEMVRGVFYNESARLVSTFQDGSALSDLISLVDYPSKVEPFGLCEKMPPLSLVIETGLFAWINSADAASKRANIVNDIFEHFLSKPLFFLPSALIPGDNHTEKYIDKSKVKTLEYILSYVNYELPYLCIIFDFEYSDMKSTHFKCKASYKSFMQDLLKLFVERMNLKYLTPQLKTRAEMYNVAWKELVKNNIYYSANYKKYLSQKNGSGYTFQLDIPKITFFAQQRENLQDFVHSFALNGSDTIKAKYAFSILDKYCQQLSGCNPAGFEFPQCSPFMNASHMHRVTHGGLAELKNIQSEIIYSYSPGAEYCTPEASLLNDGIDFSSNDCFQAVGSAFPLGLFSGALDGSASHFGWAHLVRNPVSRCMQGYLTGGPLGAGLGAAGWFLHWLPDRLRKGARPRSLRCGCATILDSLGMVLPFLSSGNVYRYAGGMLGFMLGKYGAETALGRMRPHEERSKPYRKRKTRGSSLQESKHPGEAESGKTVSREASLARLISENEGNSGSKISNATTQEIANHLKKLKHPVEALPESMLKDLAEMLPWSTPMIGDVIAAHLDNIEDSQARVSYIRERLDQCEHYMSGQSPDGLAKAVKQFPGLYLLYLKYLPQTGIDITCVDRLWAVLNRDDPSDLLMQTGKILIENHLRKTDSGAARKVLDDDKLINKNRLEIFNGLSSSEVLLKNGVPENLGSAYLEQVRLDSSKRKQNTKQHIIKAVNIWLNKYSQPPPLTDNLIHLLIDFKRLAGDEDAEALLRFGTTLHEQAIVEHSRGNNVQRRLRAKAILIALK